MSENIYENFQIPTLHFLFSPFKLVKKRCKQVNELFVFQEEVNRRGNLIRESNDKQRLIGFGCDAVNRLTFIKDPVIHDPAGLSLIPVYSNFG